MEIITEKENTKVELKTSKKKKKGNRKKPFEEAICLHIWKLKQGVYEPHEIYKQHITNSLLTEYLITNENK